MPESSKRDCNLRSVARLLQTAVRRRAGPLSQSRTADQHLYCTCRDFALLASSVLRENGIPARLRVGYADYFVPGRWEDHWVCEYRTDARWELLDAELGSRARHQFHIDFDETDVPRDRWRSAPAIWRAIRLGEIDAQCCGVSVAGIAGEWFVAAAVLRDAAALARIEALPWDYWGPGREFCSTGGVSEARAREIDRLAAALDPAPDAPEEVEAVLDRFPWARASAVVLSFPDGKTPQEIPLAP